ncbi:hypothetical protein PU560_15585, partial [Georgenia sp. 10Sc9-8]|nr:hypothetical protein [Georgenia halotolerans]
MARAALSGVLILVGATAAVSPAAAKGGPVGGSGNDYYLSSSGVPDLALTYGRHDDEVFVGDWDGDGTDTLAIRRGATFHVRNALDGGPADVAFTYGRAGDVVLVGDWDGDG